MKSLAAAASFLVFCAGASAAEFEISESKITIPEGTVIKLSAPAASIEVDVLEVAGTIQTQGKAFGVYADVVSILGSGRILGFEPTLVPAAPPKKSPYTYPAATGVAPPNQLDGALYFPTPGGGFANGGAQGSDGSTGDNGIQGEVAPGHVSIVSRSMEVNGMIALRGQTGSQGGEGQEGQDGGRGAKGQNATCGKGNTTYYCYAGVIMSGPGGLGGLGGRGGVGGPGGSAIPLVLISLGKTADETRLKSEPGAGGQGGAPGRVGKIGAVGSAGDSCSATPNWGSAFGSCSMGGGQPFNKPLTDTRANKDLGRGDPGPVGSNVDWRQVVSNLAIPIRRARLRENVASFAFDMDGDVLAIVTAAIKIEIVGRMAVTIGEVRRKWNELSSPEQRRQFLAEMAPRLAEVGSLFERTKLGPDGLATLLTLTDDQARYLQNLDFALPALRSSFVEQKVKLIDRCQAVRSSVQAAEFDRPEAFFRRVLSFCDPNSFVWSSFVLDRKDIVVKTSYVSVPDPFKQYLTITHKPFDQSESVTLNGVEFRAARTTVRENRLDVAKLNSDAAKGKIIPYGALRFSVDRARESLMERLGALNADLEQLN